MELSEKKSKVKAWLTENNHFILGIAARNLGLSDLDVLEALPEEMVSDVPVADFFSLWSTLTTWERALFLAQSPAAIVEIEGQLPEGKMGHGLFNLHDHSCPLGGHLDVDKITRISLVAKNLDGNDSLGIHFFTGNGATGFAVYAGRGEERKILPAVRESFKSLWKKYARV
ncbi:MAG: heme utilization cystosolic carrier protein HutX [Deltaproteobacteria bacterium]|nr:heme utilization cystosolic carrier protein HutX [Deltaproteobacteria bacterium]